MEKRVLIFVILTMVALYAMQMMQPAPRRAPAPAEVTNAASATGQSAPAPAAIAPLAPGKVAASSEAVAPVASAMERLVTVETDEYSAVFSSKGGTLRSFKLKKYRAEDGSPVVLLKEGARMRTLAIGVGDDYSISERNFELTGHDLDLTSGRSLDLDTKAESGTLTFTYRGDGVYIRRAYTFTSGSYGFDLEDTVEGLPHYKMTLGGDFGMFKRESQYLHVGPVLLSGTDREEFKPGKVDSVEVYPPPIKWIAIEDKYFAGAAVMRDQMDEAIVWPVEGTTGIAVRGAPGTHRMTIYGGPKEQDSLAAIGGELKYVVDFGWTSIIARPIFWLLKQLYSFVNNYGVAIILLTIMIRVPFIPLVTKGQKSMKKLQEIQPKIKAIREQYKNDPDRLNKETMAIYSKHKVNPVGGCLPLLLQIPVFFALYKVLMIAIELRGAPFAFWVQDLAMKDPYYVMPLLMGLTMFVQQKMTPATGDERTRKMLMWMPIIFTFISLSFPSGLVLYWLVNNCLSIGQQYFVNKAKD